MGIIPVSMYLYLYYQQKTYLPIKNFVMRYWGAILGFWAAGFFYMAARVYYCPLTIKQGSCALKSIDAYIALAKWRIYREGSWFLQDFFGLSWLSLRPTVLLLFAFLLFGCLVLFLQSRRKLLLGWLIMAICMLLWPCFILQYGPLYFYETSPFAVVFFVCLFACRKKEWGSVAVWAGKIMGTLFILWLMIMCYTNMRCREHKMEIRKQALQEFVARPDIKGRPLWILTFPIDGLYPSIAHAIWYYSGTYDTRIMTDSSTWIFNNWGFTTDSWLVRCCPYPDKNNYEITKHDTVIRITSLDPEKIRISHNYKSLDIPLGRNTVLATHGDVITDLSIEIDQKWVELDPLFVVWDFEQQRFRLLETV
jgi:hypothetical protein